VASAVSAGYVPVLVDADNDTVLASRYQVSSIPTILLLDADGRLVKRNNGFLPRSGMLRFLDESSD
jgi:thioredoxin-like negative regulator of GroEL